MPEDEFAMIVAAAGGGSALGVFQCVNVINGKPCGFKYVVDACTMPNASATCPECKANIGKKIGGGFHELAASSKRIAITGKTGWNTGARAQEAGMEDVGILGAADAPPGYSGPDDDKAPVAGDQYREMTPLTFRVLRYMVHGSIAMAFSMGGPSAASALTLCKGVEDAEAGAALFLKRMKVDFEMIKRLANDSTSEDAYLYLNMAIKDMEENFMGEDSSCSVDARQDAEKNFQQNVIFNLFADKNKDTTDERLSTMRAGAKTGAQEMALGAELKEAVVAEPSKLSQLLRFRQPITMDNFTYKFETSVSSEYPTLNNFLSNNNNLQMAGDLFKLLRFSNMVHNRYAGTLTRAKCQSITIMDAINEVEAEREDWTQAFIEYREAWNKWCDKIIMFECVNLIGSGAANATWTGMPYLKQKDDQATYTSDGSYPTAASMSDGWTGAAMRMNLGIAVYNSFVHDGPSAGHPESCYLKLLINAMLAIHNNKFIIPAQAQLAGADVGDNEQRRPPLDLHLVREVDMITFTMHDFEAVVRDNATQSLKYGQGGHITYDFNGIEHWVFETVVANVPEISTFGREFPFVGESLSSKEYVGGIKQEDIPEEFSAAILLKELPSLSLQQAARDRLDECIGFMDILGADSADKALSSYCQEALHMTDADLEAFGAPAGIFRTAVLVKHVASLRATLNTNIVGNELMTQCDPMYLEQLDEVEVETVKDFVEICGQENLAILLECWLDYVSTNLMGFAQPVALEVNGEPSVMNSGGDYAGLIELRQTSIPLDGKDKNDPDFNPSLDYMLMADFDWFVDNFPTDLPVAKIMYTYQLLLSLKSDAQQ